MSGLFEDSASESIRVLHVDDNPDFTDLTATFLERESDDFDVLREHDPLQALDRLAGESNSEAAAEADDEAETDSGSDAGVGSPPDVEFGSDPESIDCIVSDYEMPEMNGLEFLEAVRQEHPDLPFILFTGKGSEEIASEAISRGVTDYLQKGSGTDQYTVLANRIENATAQHRAEREIERRSKWYQRILSYSSDYILIVDEMGEVSYVSPSIERVMGYTPEETLGNDSFEYILPEDQAEAMNSFARTIENPEEEVTVEFRGRHNDGSVRWLEVRGSNFFDDPLINGAMVNVRDITARKEREQELEARNEELEEVTTQLQEQYRHLFEQLPIMAVVTREEEGRPIVEDCNERFVETLGYDKAEILERPLEEFYTPESRTKLLDEGGYSRSLSGEFIRESRELVTADGEVVETILRLIPRRSDSERPPGTLALYIDVSEREEVKREKERLQEVLNIVSHDLRNPLNVAEGRLELAREDCDSEHLAAIEQTHERMNALIDDLLRLARSGNQVDDLESIDLPDLSERCWENVVTEDGSIVVETDRTIRGDRNRLQQLFENLFRNSMEHGSTSDRPQADDASDRVGEGVTITVGDLEDGFYVEDDGPGIPEETREKIFESGYSTKDAGTGFGLAIVEEIVEAHGWEITVAESDAGGARFEITGIDGTV